MKSAARHSLDLESDTFVDLVCRSDAVQLDSMVGDGTIGLDEPSHATVCDLPVELTQHPRYRVLELLGKGGMGNVYKAEHTLMNRTVALKVIDQELVRNDQAIERFRREAQSAAQLAHPNIVTAHDAEQAGDVHFLVMEYVPGDNLSDLVKRDGPLDVSGACNYIRQAADGLQHAYENGTVHRDIKPHNLMVTSEGKVKILDFGLATLSAGVVPDEEPDQAPQRDSDQPGPASLTSAGSMMGTPDFVSPEQATDARAADIRSDIYSLGCTFYYLLAGRPPFAEGSAMERVKAHGEADPVPLEELCGDIPSELAETVRRMMAKLPAERFQTPAAVADAIGPFVDAHRVTAATRREAATHAETAPRRWWSPPIAKSLACALLAVVLAGVIYIATDSGTLVIESDDDRVEVLIRAASGDSEQGDAPAAQLRIVDTLTGSTVKRLWSGEYVLALTGDNNDFELNTNRFVLKRGGKVVVKVTRLNDPGQAVDETGEEPLAQAARLIDEGQTVTWTNTGYSRSYSKDGQRTWLDTHKTTIAYRHPGLFRNTRYDKEGNVTWVCIVDNRSGKTLSLNMKKQEVHSGGHFPFQGHAAPQGPFGWVADVLKTKPVEIIGRRTVKGKTVHVVRYRQTLDPNPERNSIDIWLDAEDKKLVGISRPGADVFDPSSMEDRDHPAEEVISKARILGSITSDIVFDAKLDAKLFSLTPPESFEIVEHPPRPSVPVTETELIEWLRLTARVNNGMFMESILVQRSERVRAALQKEGADRNDAELALGNAWRKHFNNDNSMPIPDFRDDNTVAGSFRYVGQGVKLGSANRIVCWYKLKSTQSYRAVFGDLTVKDVDPKDLPLPLD